MKSENKKGNLDYISLLSKIRHKPLIIENIFPFSYNRPFIFPYLLDKDIYLKNRLKGAFKSVKKNSELCAEIQPIINKFIIYQLLFKTKIKVIKGEFDDDFSEDLNRLFRDRDYTIYNKDKIKNNWDFTYPLDEFISMTIESFNGKIIRYNNNIKISALFIYLPQGETMINFAKDYFSQKNILYIPYPQDNNSFLLITKLIDDLSNRKDINTIKGIIFDDYFWDENFENFIEIGKKIKDIKFSSLEFIRVPIFLNTLKNIKLKYKLNKLFSSDSLLDLTIIEYKDIKNIFNMNEEEGKKLKNKILKKNEILCIDFEGHSPYTKNFFVLCENYLNKNDNFKIVIFNNLELCNLYKIDNIEKPIINLPNINNIYYENNQKYSNEKEVKEFINSFFIKNKLIYINEGYNNKDYLKYINFSEKMDIDLFRKLDKNNFSKIIIYYGNISLIYCNDINQISLINDSKSEISDKNFIDDVSRIYELLLNKNEGKLKIECGLKFFQKINKEKILKSFKILTTFMINDLSRHLNIFKYNLYEESIENFIYDNSDKEFLLIVKCSNFFSPKIICFYINNKTNNGFYYNPNYYFFKKRIHYYYNNKSVKVEGTNFLSLKLGDKCILNFNENNSLLSLNFLENIYDIGVRASSAWIKMAEIYELNKI